VRKPNFNERDNQKALDLIGEIMNDPEIKHQILKHVNKSNV